MGARLLGELDGRVAVDDEEVDVLAGIRLAVSAGGFVARLAAEARKLLNGRVETGLRHLNHAVEAREHLAAVGGVHVLNQAEDGGGDEEEAALHGDFGLVHGTGGGAQGGDDGRAVGKVAAGRADARKPRRSRRNGKRPAPARPACG